VNLSGIEPSAPQVGDWAPDFDLPAVIAGVKKRFRLAECRGQRNVVLAFYPLNWEPVSAKQLAQYQDAREKFAARNASVVALSVDSIMNSTAWEREIGPFDFALASDFWPHGEVTRRYGVLRESGPNTGSGERAIFVVDHRGKIVFRRVYESGVVPEVEETLATLRSL
jgi:alkyl hydroperoxide reductase subunit AhpC